MKIREGAYYRMRNGDVVGPIRHIDMKDYPWVYFGICWRDDGSSSSRGPHALDLIREVYVSDTPFAVQETEDEWRARLFAAGPGPLIEVHDRKTMRDEFAMEAMKN
jgi:hypothetical protein